MTAPRLRPLSAPELAQYIEEELPLAFGVRGFHVQAAGMWRGQWFERGDVAVCDDSVRPGDVVILEARFGRPRLGSLRGQDLLGDQGEPCSPSWWSAAGRLAAVYRRQDVSAGAPGWHRIEPSFSDAVIAPTRVGTLRFDPRRPARGGASRPSHSQQLCLFAA